MLLSLRLPIVTYALHTKIHMCVLLTRLKIALAGENAIWRFTCGVWPTDLLITTGRQLAKCNSRLLTPKIGDI